MRDRKEIFAKFEQLKAYACAAEQIELVDGEGGKKQPKEWVHLLTIGSWAMRPFRGDPPTITAQHFTEMLGNLARYKVKPVFDWQHNSFFGDSQAAGWIEDLTVEDGKLYGRIEWTPEGLADILTKKFRYYSPWWTEHFLDPQSGEDVGSRLLGCALTNDPYFIDGIEQELLAARGGQDMDIKKLAALLGLPETANDEQIMTSAKTHKEAADKLKGQETELAILAGVRHELQLPSTATQDEILAKFKGVVTEKDTLAKRVETLEKDATAAKVKEAVDAAQKANKIVAADRKWAEEFATRDLAGFIASMASAPEKLPSKGPLNPSKNPGDAAVVTDADRWIAGRTGQKPEDIAANRAKREAEAA